MSFQEDGYSLWEDWLWHKCYATDGVLGCWSGRGWRLCLPPVLRDGGSSFGLSDGTVLGLAWGGAGGWWLTPFPGCLGLGLSWFGWGFLLQNFSVAISVSPHVCFILVLILFSMFLGWCICGLGLFHANQTTWCLRNQGGAGGGGWSTESWLGPPGVFCCWPSQGGSSALVLRWFLDVARCYLWLFTLYINIKIDKNSCWMLDWPLTTCLGNCCSPGCLLWYLW